MKMQTSSGGTSTRLQLSHKLILLAQTGPKHGGKAKTGLAIDYFNLFFIPMFFFVRLAMFTNTKASMAKEKVGGQTRTWTNIFGAEMKAWFASLIWNKKYLVALQELNI